MTRTEYKDKLKRILNHIERIDPEWVSVKELVMICFVAAYIWSKIYEVE